MFIWPQIVEISLETYTNIATIIACRHMEKKQGSTSDSTAKWVMTP